jgi:hypothetical protein
LGIVTSSSRQLKSFGMASSASLNLKEKPDFYQIQVRVSEICSKLNQVIENNTYPETSLFKSRPMGHNYRTKQYSERNDSRQEE